jgi:hypothetical protein
MKRTVAISLLVLHLGLFTEMKEMVRLPLLVEHYLEHRELVPEMSFLQFLAMHYKTDVAHDATDMELPFKGCDQSCFCPTFTVPDQRLPVEVVSTDRQEYFVEYVSFIPSSGLDEIFQPPRG